MYICGTMYQCVAYIHGLPSGVPLVLKELRKEVGLGTAFPPKIFRTEESSGDSVDTFHERRASWENRHSLE